MANRQLTILAIEDDDGDAELLCRHLSQIPDLSFEFIHAAVPDQGIAEFAKGNVDVTFLDYQLGARTGLDVLDELRRSGDGRPIVMFTGRGNEAVAVEAMKRGAQDYLVKGELTTASLRRALNNAIEKVSLQRELAQRLDELQQGKLALAETTEQLQWTQAQLVQGDKMASVGQLAAGVAHEIGNPISFISNNLTTLKGYIESISQVEAAHGKLLQECSQNGCAVASKLEEVRRVREEADIDYVLSDLGNLVVETTEGAQRVREIVADLRDFSHADCPSLVTANINELLDASVRLAWNELKYRVEVVREYGEVSAMPCYAGKLKQVFLNLLINAVQAIKERGTITLRTGLEDEHVFIEVADTGCGVAPENLDRIFLPFFTTKESGKGTGLGLHLAQNIIQAHGGQISVRSAEGHGTTVQMALPLAGPPVAATVESVDLSPGPPVRVARCVAPVSALRVERSSHLLECMEGRQMAGRRLVVFAIDDDVGDAEILRRRLADISGIEFEFVHFTEPEEAQERLLRENVDATFLDFQLGAKTGLEVLKDIRSSGYLGSVIVLTGHGDEYVAAEIMRAGADDYLVKSLVNASVLTRSMMHAEAQHLRRRAEKELQTKNALLLEMLERERLTSQRLEEATQKAEAANRTKSEFLAKMSHELRTPLNSIIGFTEIMIDDRKDPPGEKRAQRLERVRRNARNLLALINDILDISKVEAGRMTMAYELVDVARVIAECLESVQPLLQSDRVGLRHKLDDTIADDFKWEGDEGRLRQIVTNLIGNAAKFTESGHIEVRAGVKCGCLQIDVEDTGIGIGAEDLPAIFDEFQQVDSSSTRQTGGTGLGLSICRKFAGLMGGEIMVTSEPGIGSCFTVRLPIKAAAPVEELVAQ